MADIEMSRTLGVQILQALGISPDQVTGLTLRLDAMQPAYIEIRRHAPQGSLAQVVTQVERFALVPIGEATEVPLHLDPGAPLSHGVSELEATVRRLDELLTSWERDGLPATRVLAEVSHG